MTQQEMTDRILEKCRYGGVSFVELQQAVGEESRGTFEIQLLPNVVLWSNVSEAFALAFEAARPRLDITPCSPLVYFFDGAALQLPLASRKRPPRGGYKNLHWLPVVFAWKKAGGHYKQRPSTSPHANR